MTTHPSLLMTAVLLTLASPLHADVARGADPDTGLKFWRWQDQGVLLELKQRLPDQTRAYFQARGFDEKTSDIAATSCIFQTMFRNVGKPGSGRVAIDLRQWRVVTNEGSKSMRLRDYWDRLWRTRNVPQAANIAFRWSLLPTVQEYDPQDYNWGMTSYGLPPGSAFSLEFSWTRSNQVFHGVIQDIECPADIHPETPSGL